MVEAQRGRVVELRGQVEGELRRVEEGLGKVEAG